MSALADDLFVLEPEGARHGTIFHVIGWDQYPHGRTPLYATRRALARGVLELRGVRLIAMGIRPLALARECPPVRRNRGLR